MENTEKEIMDSVTITPLDTLVSILEEVIVDYKNAKNTSEYKSQLMMACYVVVLKIVLEKEYIKKSIEKIDTIPF